MDAAEESGLGAEMQQQPHLDPGGAEIVEELTLVGWTEHFSSFRLDEYSVIYQQIESVRADCNALVRDFYEPFLRTMMAAGTQLRCQRSTIDGLEKPEPELVVALVEGADNLARQLSFE